MKFGDDVIMMHQVRLKLAKLNLKVGLLLHNVPK